MRFCWYTCVGTRVGSCALLFLAFLSRTRHGHNNNTTILLLLLGIAALCKHVKHTHTLRVCVSDQQHRRAMHQTHTNWCVCVCVCVRANEWCVSKPKTLNRAKHVYDYVCVRMRVYMCLRVRGV